MILQFSNFRKGLHNPAQCRIVKSSGNNAIVDTEFTTLKNFEIRPDGIRRRGGLTNVANLKTGSGAATSFIANKGMFWHGGISKWIVACDTGQIYEITEGSAIGASIKMIDIARNRATFAWTDNTLGVYLILGQGDNYALLSSAGVYSYYSNSGRAGVTFDRGNYWCTTYFISGISGNKARCYVDGSSSEFVTAGAFDIPVVMGGALPYNNYLLIVKEDGKVFRYSGVTSSDAELIPVGDNIGEPVKYTLVDCSPFGLMFVTTRDVFLISRLTEIDNEIQLQSVTDERFDTPITDDIDNDATTDNDLIVLDSDCAGDATVTAISSLSGYPASNINDDDITTRWFSDNDLTTGKTATASNEDGANVAGNAIDSSDATRWKTPTLGVTSTENWTVDLGAGNEQIVKGMLVTVGDSFFGPDATWNLQGSNDNFATPGTTLVKTLRDIGGYEITNTVAYRYYRIEGDTTDRGGASFYANVYNISLMTYGEAGTTNWIQFDYGAGVTKNIQKVRLYKGTETDEPLDDLVFKASTDGSDWTTLTPSLSQAVVQTSPAYYWDYYLLSNTVDGRYFKIEFTNNYERPAYFNTSGSIYEVYTYAAKTASDITTGKKAGAAWHPDGKDYYFWFTNSDGDYVCYVYNPLKQYFRQFETGSFGGTMAAKNGDLYLTLNQYTPSGGSLQPSGIFQLRTDGTGADPDTAISSQARTGTLKMDAVYKIRNIYVRGQGLDTFNIYWKHAEPGLSHSDSQSKDISAMTFYQWAPQDTIMFSEFSWEILGSTDTDEGANAMDFDLVEFDIEFVRDFTAARGKK